MSYDSNQQANLAPVYRCDSPMPSLEALIEITSVPQNGQYFQPLEEIEFETVEENEAGREKLLRGSWAGPHGSGEVFYRIREN